MNDGLYFTLLPYSYFKGYLIDNRYGDNNYFILLDSTFISISLSLEFVYNVLILS